MIKGNYINVSAGTKKTLYCLIQSITSNYDLNYYFFPLWKGRKTDLALPGIVYKANL